MVTHQEQLPECVKEHDSMWKFFWGTAGFFVLFLSITTPIVIANISDLKRDDKEIRDEQARYELDSEQYKSKIGAVRMQQFADVYQKIDTEFTSVKVQLAHIQATLEKK